MKDWSKAPDLYELTTAIPSRFIKPPPQGKHGNYIPHYVIVQAVIAAVGLFDWELVEIIRQPDGTISGSVHRMTVEVDGRRVVIEEVGSVGNSGYGNDADLLKKSSSDALKRCAMRLSKGLHVWCKTPDEFFLPAFLRKMGAGLTHPHDDEPAPVTGGVLDDERPFE